MAWQRADEMGADEIRRAIDAGGRFVTYEWCISMLVVTIRQRTPILHMPPGANSVVPGLPWTLLTLLVGWWGLPWGPIRTIGALDTNFRGGHDVTSEMKHATRIPPPPDSRPPPPVGPMNGPPAVWVPSNPAPPRESRSPTALLAGMAGTFFILGALVGLAWWFEAPNSTASADLTNSQPQLEVHSSPGQTVELTIILTQVIQRYWAAPYGIHGTLSTADGSTSITAFDIAATSPDWGNSIRTSKHDSPRDVEISSRFEVPEGLETGSVLTGQMAVSVIYPELAGEDSFFDRTHDTTVNMRLVVDDVDRARPIVFLPVIGLVGVAGVALFVRGITLARNNRESAGSPGVVRPPQP